MQEHRHAHTHTHTHAYPSLLTGHNVLTLPTSTQKTTDLPEPKPLLPRPSNIHDGQCSQRSPPPPPPSFHPSKSLKRFFSTSPLLLALFSLCSLSPFSLIAPLPCSEIALQVCRMLPDEVGCCST